ncbi:tRNA (adenosine(37)-N6)-dimethylallyltransferase MiaA [Nitrosomonas sp. Nm132]|jgi:tRNA dimethylallyltransferase|uniref:tRNA (adenosine(37)-N6)-dimethylallyltransferase MiaA n=1 Tax=Nitrosomonas sp. Nm132 TaxID=1881053 RepID=UPI0008911DC3|nr:tRNA (adenosine(37)-N6)-dimethylallyltransferase MiaA [Nitrosomonas sp. Nm132]SDH86052.1 tRNA dimethylallyltransferase [Nitrosomonas sp. Nm132]
MLSQHNVAKLPPAILLMGPTASGKSNAAMEIAQHFPVEIISVDSAQVYREMNIGSAKPDQHTLAAVPHHLIDLINPDEHYSAAQFRKDALTRMDEITAKGKIPLLVGGTMLYFKALKEGLSELPPADNSLRKEIEMVAEKKGWPEMHQMLSQLDPVSAARIKPHDSQRIQRALEVCYLTGRPMSAVLTQPKNISLPYQLISMALLPNDRKILHQRILLRFERMLEMGLIDEVRTIRDQYCVNAETPSMRCVGYRQVYMYLDNLISLTTMKDMGIAATRQLAKRQLTWLRGMTGLQEFDCLAENLSQQVIAYLQTMNLTTNN